jgi:hypothetical protein
VLNCLEDCDFFFDVTYIPDHCRIETVISYLIGEAREWYWYYKLTNYNHIRLILEMNFLILITRLTNLRKYTGLVRLMNSFVNMNVFKTRVAAK